MSKSHLHNLSRLEHFSLSSTSFVFDVGHDWIPLFSLVSIEIRDCQLNSSFPAWLKTQKEISFMVLTNLTIFNTIPEWLWKFSKIVLLDLSNNHLRGELPHSISFNFRAIIDLGSNFLEGSLPLWPNVTELYLGNNKFSGPIPLDIGLEMPWLNNIDLSKNYLNGSIPPSISRMKNLASLGLSNNYLTGKISVQWIGLQKLRLLDLSKNNLSGTIPSSICSQFSLVWLRLSSNNLFGELNPSLQGCAGLLTLDLGGNRFSGTIPKWIGENLTSISYLLLGANMFTGSLPEQLCQLSQLKVLDLSHNNISGPIPKCLGNLDAMKSVGTMSAFHLIPYLPDNQYLELNVKGIQYEHYTSLFQLLNSIDLSRNNLSEDIPEELMNLSTLVALNLSRNQLTGRILESIGRLQRLESLDLSSNHLQGPIPSSMTSITLLSKLNLSYNNLFGPIPSTNQFQTFNDPTMYEGNSELFGPPLPTQCLTHDNGDSKVKEYAVDEDKYEKLWLYASTVLGFIVGF